MDEPTYISSLKNSSIVAVSHHNAEASKCGVKETFNTSFSVKSVFNGVQDIVAFLDILFIKIFRDTS